MIELYMIVLWVQIKLFKNAVIAVNAVKTYEIQGYINLTAFVGYQNADKKYLQQSDFINVYYYCDKH